MNGQAFTWGYVFAGVPQGSILGPLFFSIYMNDFTANLKCSVKLFVEDESLFIIVQDLDVAASDWRTSFNPDAQKQVVELVFQGNN